MNLLYILNQRFPTEKAYGRQVMKMCSNFARQSGVQVELLYPARQSLIRSDPFEYFKAEPNFKATKISAPDFYWPAPLESLSFGLKSIIGAWILSKEAKTRPADLIYSRDELVLYLLSFSKTHLVFEAHKLQSSRNIIYRRLRDRGVKIIAITQALKDDFIKIGFRSENIFVAHDGVDADVIRNQEEQPMSKESARAELGLPHDVKIVVYTGSLYRWKGVYTLADAASSLPDVRFILVGGDERGDEAELRKYLASKKIENVTITGYVESEERITRYLAAADTVILPNSARDLVSLKYTSPIKLFSYMASRRPIVASDLPSLREILNNRNAVFVKPDNSAALTEGIKKIFIDGDGAQKMSECAFEDVKKHTWEKRAQDIINFLTA